jgi:nitronate monooxygenase
MKKRSSKELAPSRLMKADGLSDRRDFLRQAALLAAGLATHAATAQPQRTALSMDRVDTLLNAFGAKYPIFCAGMGGVAMPELAIAVSNAGGVGALGSAGLGPDMIRESVARVKAGTDGPFAVNFLLTFGADALPVVLDAGAPIIQFAWGIPTADMVATIRRAGAKLGVQIGSPDGARLALDAGADYLICQGTEAGGHVQATSALYDVLAAVVDVADRVPVLAAGGVANGVQIRRALVAGASGALVGTRFVATVEANTHDDYKRAIAEASASDTVMTVCFQNEWPSAPHRVLRNGTFRNWEAAGCPPVGRRPGEGDVVTTNPASGPKLRYSVRGPEPGDQGAVTDLVMYAGTGVSAIEDTPSAAALLERLWEECLAAA